MSAQAQISFSTQLAHSSLIHILIGASVLTVLCWKKKQLHTRKQEDNSDKLVLSSLATSLESLPKRRNCNCFKELVQENNLKVQSRLRTWAVVPGSQEQQWSLIPAMNRAGFSTKLKTRDKLLQSIFTIRHIIMGNYYRGDICNITCPESLSSPKDN